MTIIKYTFLLLLFTSIIAWTPDTLYYNYTDTILSQTSTINKTIVSKVIDPNNYIPNDEEIYNKIITIEQNYNISVLLIVIDKMDEPLFGWFSSKKKVDRIRQFATDFENLYYNNNKTLIDNSMTLLFSLQDRKMRINAGKIPRKVFSNYGRQRLMDNIKPELRKRQYEKAFTLILNNIIDYENFMYRHYFLIIAIVAILFIFFCIGTLVGIKNDKERNFANSKLAKINNMVIELHKGQKNVKDLVNENCVICLESFIEKEKNNNLKNLQKPLLEHNEEKQIKDLYCGHKFHIDCLNKYKELTDNKYECPICYEKLRDNASPQELSEKVFNIQRLCYPILGTIKLNMNGGILSLNE